ncbi:NusG domain II-containing protein [Tannockella kyphosi]|uniref:NusG domain II-containing protein n=1 Tax=Tannockella kyphosi TaxID=2899121 RepID=UPI002010C933|nr:NusG domain II-containing protein [Tannockella kyphosi]
MKRNDWILIIGIVLLASIVSLYLVVFTSPGTSVIISVQGEFFGEYDITENQEIVIDDCNVICIEDGKVSMVSADCPDHLCIQQGEIELVGESIICLPNQVIVSIEGNDTQIDAVAK